MEGKSKKNVYIAYVVTANASLGCIGMAFVKREDGVVTKISSHYSSNVDWAKHDMRTPWHCKDYEKACPEGYHIVELGEISAPLGIPAEYEDKVLQLIETHEKCVA